jgi:PIN domain nuclease of toxin-antitoxin system
MRLLLDSAVLLWWAHGDARLGADAGAAIADGANSIVVSAVSIWEIEIKRAAGKVSTAADLARRVVEEGLEELPITFEHAEHAGRLPPIHADPFDRILVAQARLEGLSIVTSDSRIAQYAVPVLQA